MNIARKLLEKQIQKDIAELKQLRVKDKKGLLDFDDITRIEELEESIPKKTIKRNNLKP